MSDWDSQPLGDLATNISTGSTPSTARQEFFGGTVQWFTPGDIGNSKKLVASSRTITSEALANGKVRLFEKASLLVTCIGEIGRVGVLQQPSSSNQQITAIKFGDDVDENFAYYWFVANQKQLTQRANLAIVPILNNERLKEIVFSHPPLTEQRRIAALLDKTDHLRRTRRYAAQLSDTFLQAVFAQMFGDPVRNEMGWQLERLSEVLELPPQYGLYVPPESYSNDPKEGIEMVHMSDLFYGMIERGLLKRVKSDVAGLEPYHIDHSDLLIARRSLTYEGAAKPCRIPISDAPLLFESSMLRIRPDRKKMDPIYLYHYLADERARIAHVQKYVTRSTISGINQSNLCDVEVLRPPLALQQKFARIVQQFERLRAQQREAERQAEHLFQTLLHRAFSGEG